jgi:hypothetical protein
LDLPESIATMQTFANRVERTNLGKCGEIGAGERRNTAREFLDGREGSL